MFVDPVFEEISNYKNEHKGDVIRFEIAIRTEITRIHQYQKHAFTEKSKKHLDGVEHVITGNLNRILLLIPLYLNSRFNEELKKTPFWERRALKANCLNWKYTYYAKEREAARQELIEILSDKGKTSIKQVKENAK